MFVEPLETNASFLFDNHKHELSNVNTNNLNGFNSKTREEDDNTCRIVRSNFTPAPCNNLSINQP